MGHLLSEYPLTGDERELLNRLPESKKITDTHPGSKGTMSESSRDRHSWILRVAIHVRSETGGKKDKVTLNLLAGK